MFAATARFRAAYLATHYVALTPAGPLTLRIGQRSAVSKHGRGDFRKRSTSSLSRASKRERSG